MAFLKRNQIKDMVAHALQQTADFSADFEEFTFENFHAFHKQVFVTSLKITINASPHFNRDGIEDFQRFYDVPLSDSVVDSWITIGDCIDYILNNQIVRIRHPKLDLR